MALAATIIPLIFLLWVAPFRASAFVLPSHPERRHLPFVLKSTLESQAVVEAPQNGKSLDDVMTKALSNMYTIMDPSFVEEYCSPFVQELFGSCAESVHVKPSTIRGAGRGLFASRDLKAGTIVSAYPVHALGVNFLCDGSSTLISSAQDSGWDYKDSSYTMNLLSHRPLLDWDLEQEDQRIYVDANPQRDVPPSWQAHRINDGSMIRENSLEAVLNYYQKAAELQNAAIVSFGPSPMCVAVTTRDVRKGEELFTPYGFSYWMGRFGDTETWVEKTDEVVGFEKNIVHVLEDAEDSVEERYISQAEELMYIFDKL